MENSYPKSSDEEFLMGNYSLVMGKRFIRFLGALLILFTFVPLFWLFSRQYQIIRLIKLKKGIPCDFP